jgi:hypothetical protein
LINLLESKVMKTTRLTIQLAFLSICILFSLSSLACTTDLWNGGVTGDPAPLAGSPLDVSRVSGLCAMQLSDSGSVRDTSPSAEDLVFVRFYVFAEVTAGDPVIFEAFSDDAATTSLLSVTFDGTNFDFEAGDTASGDVPGRSGWNLIELAWASGGTMDYWVNVDSSEAPTGSVNAVAGAMESVVLGAAEPASFTGKFTFDDYVSHRETKVGELLAGDGNSDGDINSGDINVIVNEFLNNNLGEGVVDCNLDGSVNSGDINCVVAIFLNL